MKILLWLTFPILFLTAYFVVPQLKSQPETDSESPIIQAAEPVTTPSSTPASLSIFPTTLIQGEPALITLHGISDTSSIESLTLDGKPLAVFANESGYAALVGIDPHKEPGSYPIILTLKDGRKIEEEMEIGQRTVATEAFDIPEQLGGNTPQAEHELSSTLAQDSLILNSITAIASPEKLWDGQFRLPLDGSPVVTDVYGYSRKTGSVTLGHQGTDFRASLETPVYAMNAGIVVFAKSFRNYGNTVIIDHGLGLMTLYMHLSETDVKRDDRVEKGALIAKSGNTGYSLGPHLHLSVRIGGVSIDPQKFLEFMGSR